MMQKHAITIRGHRTSVSLEPEFWAALRQLATAEGRSLAALVAEIDAARSAGGGQAKGGGGQTGLDAAAKLTGLSSAIRVYVLQKINGKVKKIT